MLNVRSVRALASLLFWGVCAAYAHGEAFEAAKAPKTHLLMRHAQAPGVGDPSNFALYDCATQRNLSEAGRLQAQQIGVRLRTAGVAVDRVLTSAWCRCKDTAALLQLGAVEAHPSLNSFFREPSASGVQTAAARALLQALDTAGQKAILVTHQVNITALTGVFPASGEIIAVRVDGDALRVVGRIAPPQ